MGIDLTLPWHGVMAAAVMLSAATGLVPAADASTGQGAAGFTVPDTPGAWSAPVTLDPAPHPASLGWVASGSNSAGDIAALVDRKGTPVLWRYHAATRTWSKQAVPAVVRVQPSGAPYPTNPQRRAAVTLDAAGTVTLVWDTATTYADVGGLGSARLSGGAWTVLAMPGARAARGSVRAACDSAGLVVAAWVDPAGAVMASPLAPDATGWTKPTVAVPAPTAEPKPAYGEVFVDVAVTASGDAYLAAANTSTTGREALRLVRMDAGSGSWGPARPLLQNSPRVEYPWGRPDVAVDDAGHAVVAWTQGTREGNAHALGEVYALRYDPATGAWDDQPATLSAGRARASAPLAAIGSRGDVIVAWSENEYAAPGTAAAGDSRGMRAARFDAAAGMWKPTKLLPWGEYLQGAGTPLSLGVDAAGDATLAWLTWIRPCVYLSPPRDFLGDCIDSRQGISTSRYDAARDAWTAPSQHPGSFAADAMAVAPDGSVALLADDTTTLAASRFARPTAPGLVMRGAYRILSVPREHLYWPMTYDDPVTTAADGTGVWFVADTYGIPAGTPVTVTKDGLPQGSGVVGADLTVSIPWTRPGITAGTWQITTDSADGTDNPGGAGRYSTVPLTITTVPKFGIASHTIRGGKVTFTVNPGNAVPWQQISLTRNGRSVAHVTVKRQFTPLTITVAARPGVYQVRTMSFDRWEYGTRSGVTVLM